MSKQNNEKIPMSLGCILIRVAAVLFILTAISAYLLSGVFAQYVASGNGGDSARVVKFGDLTISETGDFDGTAVKKGMIIPGVNLTKDATVHFESSEVATVVFVEVMLSSNWTKTGDTFSVGDHLSWTVAAGWTYLPNDANTANHKYVYYKVLDPNEELTADFIAENGKITVSEDESKNVLKFYYVYMEDVPYSVEYWIKDGDGTLRPAFRKVDSEPGYEFVGETTINESEAYVKRVENHGKAVVTEDYIRADNYRPDALQHRLIITSDEKQNVIKFIYTYDPNAAFYTVNYYILKPGVTTPASAADYDLYTNTQSVGTVGQTYSSQPIEIPGTTFNETVTDQMRGSNTWNSTDKTLSAVLAGDNSTHLDFFYTRNPYPYQVRYVTEGRDLTTPKTTDGDGNQLQAQYGATVTESAMEFEGYKVDAVSKSHTIQIGTAAQNTIIFYYTRMTGDLKITKSVMLDEEQAEEDSSLKLPDNADTIPFNFTVSGAEALHKSSYAYTITRKDGTVEKGTVKVDAGSYGKALEPISLCDGDSVVIHGLALGTYTVAEEHVIGYKTTINGVESEHLDLTLVADGEQVTADVVNTYPFFTGDLVLSKTIKKLSDTDPDGTGEIFTFTITVTPAEGTLEETRITKYFTLDNDGKPVETTYSIPAKGYGKSYTFSLLLKAGETVTVSDIPAGTFKVVETIDEEHYATEYYKVTYDKKNNINTQVTGTSDTVNGEIHGGHATQVGYTNTYKKGGLTIEKTVTQEMSYDGWQSDTFTFRVTGTTMLPDGDYTVEIDETEAIATVIDGIVTMSVDPQVAVTRDDGWNNSVTITNLPAGIYTVEEIGAGLGMEAYTSTPGSRKVENLKLPESATAEFHNMFLRSSGDLYISKTISIVPGSGAEIDPKAEFTFTVVMPEDGDFESKTYTGIDQDNATKDFTVVDGKFTFKLKHDQSMLLQDLPVGSYTVTEAPASGYASSFPVAGADGYVQVTQDVKMNQETRLECVNRFPVYVGNLIIRKTVTQESTLDALPDDEFAFQIHLGIAHAGKTFQTEGAKTTVTADANGVIAVSLKNGEYIHIKNLPEGNCTVTESLTALQQEKYQPSYKVNSEAKTAGTVAHINIASGQDNTVIYDNLYLRQRTELTITKTNAADAEQVFVYEVKNKTTGEVITVTVVGNGSTTIHDLPFGEYTVTQKNDWSWRFLDPAEDVTLDKNDRETGEEVTFIQAASINKWLDGNSWLIKNRKKGGT